MTASGCRCAEAPPVYASAVRARCARGKHWDAQSTSPARRAGCGRQRTDHRQSSRLSSRCVVTFRRNGHMSLELAFAHDWFAVATKAEIAVERWITPPSRRFSRRGRHTTSTDDDSTRSGAGRAPQAGPGAGGRVGESSSVRPRQAGVAVGPAEVVLCTLAAARVGRRLLAERFHDKDHSESCR